jgi:FtsP/CotA-like multicopper oxidase with cupredoxin domain
MLVKNRAFCFLFLAILCSSAVQAEVFFQKPPDVDGIDTDYDGNDSNDHVFLHMAAGDGFVNMADGKLQYMFGFKDVTDVNDEDVMGVSMLAAEFPGPQIVIREGQMLYLTLTNVGMVVRPDLFDPHTIHFHGFPEAAAVYDGVPELSFSINMGASLTYFYYAAEPGTYMWHCHVEATEHMQMGMLAQIHIEPNQNVLLEDGEELDGHPDGAHAEGDKYVYNDGDGASHYDVEYSIQLHGFDSAFHDASLLVQPLPFAKMEDNYTMINGRGYPETVDTNELYNTASDEGFEDIPAQKIHALITADQGDLVLIRLTGLTTIEGFTMRALGIPMKVIGKGARIYRGPDPDGSGEDVGIDAFYETSSINVSGGEAYDVLLDTADVEPGTYFLYTTNMNYLCNNLEDYGGMMTEIRINAGPE